MKYNLTYLDYGYNSYLHSNGEQSGGKDSGSGKSANTTTNVGVGTGETQTTNVGGGTGILTNDQIGLINANAQANLNVSLFDSGAGAAGAAAGSALLGGVAVVASVAMATLSVVQIFNTYEKQKAFTNYSLALGEQEASLSEDLALEAWQIEQEILALKEAIAIRNANAQANKILLIGSGTILGVAALVIFYKLKKAK